MYIFNVHEFNCCLLLKFDKVATVHIVFGHMKGQIVAELRGNSSMRPTCHLRKQTDCREPLCVCLFASTAPPPSIPVLEKEEGEMKRKYGGEKRAELEYWRVEGAEADTSLG